MKTAPATPYFLVSEEKLRNNIESFRSALEKHWPGARMAYSVKTNSLPWLLEYMHSQGLMAEGVSDEEYMLSRSCGFEHSQIIFNGPIKSVSLAAQAVEQGAIVNLDSNREIRALREGLIPNRENLGLRINVDAAVFGDTATAFKKDGFRFGFSEESGELKEALEAFRGEDGVIRAGMHLHCNTISRSVELFRILARYTAALIEKYSWEPSYIDIGGGFFGPLPGKPSAEEYLSAICGILEKAVDKSRTGLMIEPGTAVIASAVDYYTTVTDVRNNAQARIVTTDGSRFHIDPVWSRSSYDYELCSKGSPMQERQIISGYTCMETDRLMEISGERALSEGDGIIYRNVGAYTATLGGAFIRYFPEVWAQLGDKTELIRSRMSVEDYYYIQSLQKK